MNRYEAAITSVVRAGVSEHMTRDQLVNPLIEQIAVLVAISAAQYGAKLDDLVELARHELDLRVTHHAHQIGSGR